MKKYINGKYVDLTDDELNAVTDSINQNAVLERKRPFTESEVTSMLVTAQINTISVDDQTALRMMEFYPTWAEGQDYAVDYKVQYKGKLYKVIIAHASQADWTPDTATTLFMRIDEEHDGSKYDPIPYDGNMTLYSWKYYVQDGVTYLCNRDTENPVYNALADLVGIYVDIVS